ncbi:MAG TPA: hypothetical protein VF514_04535 [Bacteroidota bacterium]
MSRFLVLLVMLVASPAAKGVAGEHPLRSTRTLGTGGDAILYSVSGISVDRRSNVYVTDLLDYSVKKFDKSGACVGKVGRRGTGPGEFRSPALSLVIGGRLVVLQMEDPRIQVFDTGLVYRGGFIVPWGMPVDITPGWPRGMAIALYSDSSRGMVLRYEGSEGGPPRRILLEPTGKGHPLYSASRIAVCRDGTLVVAYLFRNRVELYSREGRFRRWFSVGGMVHGEEDDDDRGVPEKTYFRKVLLDDAGNILLLGGNQAPHPGRDIFVCKRDGSCIRTFVLPSRSRVVAAGEKNTLYATDEAGTRVEKYILR